MCSLTIVLTTWHAGIKCNGEGAQGQRAPDIIKALTPPANGVIFDHVFEFMCREKGKASESERERERVYSLYLSRIKCVYIYDGFGGCVQGKIVREKRAPPPSVAQSLDAAPDADAPEEEDE